MQMPWLLRQFATTASLLFSAYLSAGSPVESAWKPVGPEGGAAEILLIDPVDPETVFAAGRNGVFRSRDGGRSWLDASQGLGSRLIRALELDPKNPALLYTAVEGEGVYKSLDAGLSWNPASQGLATLFVNCLEVDPNQPQVLYAGTTLEGIFKSLDGGGSWSPINQGLTFDYTFIGLAVAPSDSSVIYAASLFSGIYKSQDAGASWRRIAQGVTPSPSGSLAVHPNDPDIVLAAGQSDIFRSQDGETWEGIGECIIPFGCVFPRFVRQLVFDANQPSRAYAAVEAGLFASDDAGLTWSQVESLPGEPQAFAVAVDPSRSDTLFAGTSSGTLKSRDGGESWFQVQRGLRLLPAVAVDVDPVNPSVWWAGTEHGLFKSTNGGAGWSLIREQLSSGPSPILVNPKDPFKILHFSSLSLDGGQSWGSQDFPITGEPRLFRRDPADSDTFYLVGRFPSTDSTQALARSIDGGVTWETLPGPIEEFIIDLSIDHQAEKPLFALAPRALFNGDLEGQAWESVSSDLPGELFNVLELAGGRIYLGSESGQVFTKPVAGGAWENRSAGLPGAPVEALALDPLRPGVVYAGLWGGGVYRSLDGGGGWVPLGRGLESPFVSLLRLPEDAPERLLAATFGGLYQLQLSQPAASFELTLDSESEFRIDDEVEYRIVLTNGSASQLPDSPGFELIDTLTPELELSDAQADRGRVSFPPSVNAVAWDGQLAAGESVSILVRARVRRGFAGVRVANQARVQLDLDGDGRSESFLLSDDPDQPGSADPHWARIEPPSPSRELLALPNSVGIESTFVGVAVVNSRNADDSTILLRGLDGQGQPVTDEIARETLAFGQQSTFNTFEALPEDADTVTVEGQPGALDGFFLLGDFPQRRLDGIGGRLQDGRDLFIPEARQSAGRSTRLFVFNPDPADSAVVRIQLFSDQGEALGESSFSLGPKGSLQARLDELDLAQEPILDGYLRLRSNRRVRSFALFHDDRAFWTHAARRIEISPRLTAPHFFLSGADTTRLRLLNPSSVEADLTVGLIDDTRGPVAETRLILKAGELKSLDLGGLEGIEPGEAYSGFLEIEGLGPLSGRWRSQPQLLASVDFDFARAGTRSVLPIESNSCEEGCSYRFLQVANDPSAGIFQGVAVTNPSSESEVFSLSLFDRDGEPVADLIRVLAPESRFVALFDETEWTLRPDGGEGPIRQIGGWMFFSSSGPLPVFTLFGGRDFLASVQGR